MNAIENVSGLPLFSQINTQDIVPAIKKAIENCKRLSNNITKVLIDDTNFTRIKNVCDEYVEKGFLTEISEEYGIHTKTHRLYKYVFD